MKTFRAKAFRIALSEGESGQNGPQREIQVIRCGTFHHAQYGTFEITPEILRSFKKNFDENVRGIDLAVDYKHASEDVAAGWFRSLSLKNEDTELWAEVDWTPNGQKVLSDKEFRYVSADFTLDYKDNESLSAHGPTLMGAGLTNRPVVKRMDPVIELSEGKGNEMDKDQRIAELEKQLADMNASIEADKAEKTDLQTKLAEAQAKIVDAEKAQALSEQKSKFDKMLSEGKVVEAQREAFMSNDFVKFSELSQPVKLSDKGNGEVPPAPVQEEGDAQDQVLKLAEEKVAKKEATSISAAISMVLSENAELAAKLK